MLIRYTCNENIIIRYNHFKVNIIISKVTLGWYNSNFVFYNLDAKIYFKKFNMNNFLILFIFFRYILKRAVSVSISESSLLID